MTVYISDNCILWVFTLRSTVNSRYVGEMITSDEAEERGKKYDAEGRTYLFDLDFNLGKDTDG